MTRPHNHPRSSSLGSEHPSSPTFLGYHLPAEWEPHEGTWLAWPHNHATWPGRSQSERMQLVYRSFAQLVGAIAADEAVHISVNDSQMEKLAHDVLKKYNVAGHIQFHHVTTDNAWCRDHGATIVVNHSDQSSYPTRVAVDWGYNGCGMVAARFENDNAVASQMARIMQMPCVSGGMILEGGSVESNGKGLAITTESCLLNPNRNPGVKREQIEERLSSMLGAETVIWLPNGIAGDETGGHVDLMARWINENTVAVALETDANDANYRTLHKNLELLQRVKLPGDKRLKIETLPMPKPVTQDGIRLPATYTSFYLTNHSVIVPTFEQPTDQTACEKIGKLFPTRNVVGINCLDILHSCGGLHSLMMQIPMA